MGHINSIEINRFRGIKQLEITDFSNINLIVGDNNSGKTTFLEAIQLLFAKTQLGSIKKIINQRSVLSPDRNSFYVSFIKMFNIEQPADQLEFDKKKASLVMKLCNYLHYLHAKRCNIKDLQLFYPKLPKFLSEPYFLRQTKKEQRRILDVHLWTLGCQEWP